MFVVGLLIYLLAFLGVWWLTKSPLLGAGAVAILWSILTFFHDKNEARIEANRPKTNFQVEDSFYKRNPNPEE